MNSTNFGPQQAPKTPRPRLLHRPARPDELPNGHKRLCENPPEPAPRKRAVQKTGYTNYRILPTTQPSPDKHSCGSGDDKVGQIMLLGVSPEDRLRDG